MDTLDNSLRQNPNTPLVKPAIEYGVIFSLIGLVMLLGAHYGGINQDGWTWRIITWAISIAMVGWMLMNFRDKKNAGFLRFGQGVGLSVLTGVFSGILTAIFFYIFVTMIAPEFMENIQNQTIENMQNSGMSDAEIEQGLKMAEMFTSPGVLAIFMLVGSVIMYLILGLILSAILKRE